MSRVGAETSVTSFLEEASLEDILAHVGFWGWVLRFSVSMHLAENVPKSQNLKP